MEILRIIREDEPPKPSTRLSAADELPSISANRGLQPNKLSALVRGELDWIVMKALEKDRKRRYETANGFALDIQRYLADEPVLSPQDAEAWSALGSAHNYLGQFDQSARATFKGGDRPLRAPPGQKSSRLIPRTGCSIQV